MIVVKHIRKIFHDIRPTDEMGYFFLISATLSMHILTESLLRGESIFLTSVR